MQYATIKLALAVLLAAPAAAQLTQKHVVSQQDPAAEILTLIQANNDAEIEAGRAARNTGNHPGVKEFGRLMVEHHSASNQKLKTAGVQPLVTPAIVSAKQKAAEYKRRLDRAPKDQFDGLYVSQQIAAHRSLLESLDAALADREALGANAALVQRTRGMVEDHLQRATRLQQELRRDAQGVRP